MHFPMIALPFFPGTLRFREADFFRVFNSVAHGFCADPGMIFVRMQLEILLYEMSGTESTLKPEINMVEYSVFKLDIV